MSTQALRRNDYKYCEKHEVEYIEYCCSCALGLPPHRLSNAALEILRQHLYESYTATERAMREDDLVKLELFARVLAHDAKVLQQELQATEEGVVKHE